jgi:hypothetical protein
MRGGHHSRPQSNYKVQFSLAYMAYLLTSYALTSKGLSNAEMQTAKAVVFELGN